jgi:hypothetical protein
LDYHDPCFSWRCPADYHEKKGRADGDSKAHKIIAAAMLLVLITGFFPPYYVLELNEEGKIDGWHIKWEFSKDLRDLINGQEGFKTPDGKALPLIEIDDMYALETLRYEIFGILVLAGAGLMITKKKKSVEK